MKEIDLVEMDDADTVFCPHCGIVGNVYNKSPWLEDKPCPYCNSLIFWVTVNLDPEDYPAVVEKHGKEKKEGDECAIREDLTLPTDTIMGIEPKMGAPYEERSVCSICGMKGILKKVTPLRAECLSEEVRKRENLPYTGLVVSETWYFPCDCVTDKNKHD